MASKRLIILTVLLLFSLGLIAQQATPEGKHKLLYLETGGMLSSFQDQKFSDVRYSGLGMGVRLDYSLAKKNFWDFGAEAFFNREHAATYDVGKAGTQDYRLFVTWLRPLITTPDATLSLGLTPDIFFSMRSTAQLSNNAAYLIFGYTVKVPVEYTRRINDKWVMHAGLSLQLFGWMQENMSFTYTTSQHVLEKGEFNYDDVPADISFVPLWKYLDIRTRISFALGKRWIFGYRWNMQESYQVAGYPMIKGYSALTVGYNIVNRIKEKKAH